MLKPPFFPHELKPIGYPINTVFAILLLSIAYTLLRKESVVKRQLNYTHSTKVKKKIDEIINSVCLLAAWHMFP